MAQIGLSHAEAALLLPDFAADGLGPGFQRELAEHVSRCEECRQWVDTYGVMAKLTRAEAARHLSSHEVAVLALDGRTLSEAVRERCERHLAHCAECTGELELTQAGVLEARESTQLLPSLVAESGRSLGWRAGLALAATLTVVLGGLLWAGSYARVPRDVRVAETIVGKRTIEAQNSIFVDATELRTGADVTLRTGSVAFGDGFVVQPGASLVVVVESGRNSEPGSISQPLVGRKRALL